MLRRCSVASYGVDGLWMCHWGFCIERFALGLDEQRFHFGIGFVALSPAMWETEALLDHWRSISCLEMLLQLLVLKRGEVHAPWMECVTRPSYCCLSEFRCFFFFVCLCGSESWVCCTLLTKVDGNAALVVSSVHISIPDLFIIAHGCHLYIIVYYFRKWSLLDID